jgi:hypothetical protein
VVALVDDDKFAHVWDDDPVVRGTSTGDRERRWLLENKSFSKTLTTSKLSPPGRPTAGAPFVCGECLCRVIAGAPFVRGECLCRVIAGAPFVRGECLCRVIGVDGGMFYFTSISLEGRRKGLFRSGCSRRWFDRTRVRSCDLECFGRRIGCAGCYGIL